MKTLVSIIFLAVFLISCDDYFGSTVTLTVSNNRPYVVEFNVHRGDLIETENVMDNTQNLAVLEDYEFSIGPNETANLTIRAACINPGKEIPVQQPVRPTPLRLQNSNFQNQQQLWDRIRSNR